MSAIVAPPEAQDVFWFLDEEYNRFHAFELVSGELESGSICGAVREYAVEIEVGQVLAVVEATP